MMHRLTRDPVSPRLRRCGASAAVVWLALVAGVACGDEVSDTPTDNTLTLDAETKQSKVFRIGYEAEYEPYNYLDGETPAGFEVELGNAICQAVGIKCQWVPYKSALKAIYGEAMPPADDLWSHVFDPLLGTAPDGADLPAWPDEGKFDLLMASLGRRSGREQRDILFSLSYYNEPLGLIVHGADSGRFFDTSGKANEAVRTATFVTQNGDCWEEFLRADYGPEIKIVQKNNQQEMRDQFMAQAGSIMVDGLAAQQLWLKKLGAEGSAEAGKYVFAKRVPPKFPPLTGDYGVGIALRPDTEGLKLRSELNRALARLAGDGQYCAISNKWFGGDMWDYTFGPPVEAGTITCSQ